MRILGIFVGDPNGDGKNELVVVREGSIEVYGWNGNDFEKLYEIFVPVFYLERRSLRVEDVDADGQPELIIGYLDSDRRIHIDVYSGESLETEISSSVPGGDVHGVFISDINDDKEIELIAFGSNSQGFTTMTIRRITKPKLMRLTRVPIGVKIIDCSVGDVDGDGHLEAIVLSEDGIYYRKPEMRKFEKYPIEVYDVHTIEVADVNGDLYLELVLASRSGIYVYAGKDMLKYFDSGAEKLIVHDVDNDGADELVIISAGKICYIDVSTGNQECKNIKKTPEYLAAGKFGDKRLIIGADESEFRIIDEKPFEMPDVIKEFERISSNYKPIIADITLRILSPEGEKSDLEGILIKETRRFIDRGEISKAYRTIYDVFEGRVPNPKKAARITVLFALYLIKNPSSKIRGILEKLASEVRKKEKPKAISRAINPWEALERIKQGNATEDDLIAAVALFLHDPRRIKNKVARFFDAVRSQLGSSAALDALLTIFPVAPKSVKAEILLTIMANYLQGKLSPNEIRSAFKRAAKKVETERELFELFADVVHKYGQRGMAALIAALSYTKANPDVVKNLFTEPPATFKLSRPSRLENIPIPDARLVPLILYGRVTVVMKKDISGPIFWLRP